MIFNKSGYTNQNVRKERKGEYLNDKHNDGLCACGMQLQFGQCARNKTKLKMMKMPIHEVKKKNKVESSNIRYLNLLVQF